jgi:hypothetical protein
MKTRLKGAVTMNKSTYRDLVSGFGSRGFSP